MVVGGAENMGGSKNRTTQRLKSCMYLNEWAQPDTEQSERERRELGHSPVESVPHTADQEKG